MSDHQDRDPKLFDQYATCYTNQLKQAVAFSGQDSKFFSQAKAELLEYLTPVLGLTPPLHLLDVGCGNGGLHPELTKVGMRVVGVDVAQRPLALAKIQNPTVEYCAYDGFKLPFRNDTFDAVLAVCVFHHVEVAHRDNLVAEMFRTVRPGGAVLIMEHNPLNPATRLVVARCPYDEDAILVPARESRALLRRCGAFSVNTHYYLFAPFENRHIRKIEHQIGWLPLGAQYCTFGTKT